MGNLWMAQQIIRNKRSMQHIDTILWIALEIGLQPSRLLANMHKMGFSHDFIGIEYRIYTNDAACIDNLFFLFPHLQK